MSDNIKRYPGYRGGHRQQAAIDPKDTQAVSEHRDGLYYRLEQGYQRIEQGLEEGQDVTTWEEFWVALLHEYERVCEELQRELAE